MTTTPTTKRSLASLKLPRPVPALLSLARSVVTAMTSNSNFPTPTPTLAEVTAAITALDQAESAAKTRAHGALAARNDKRTALVALLEELRACVQKTADAHLDTASAIIQSAGMQVRKPAVHPKRVFAATPGAVSGLVKLIAPAAARRASYNWEYSADGGKTWTALPDTLQAKTTLAGQMPGTTVTFRYRAVVKTGQGDWSQPISLMV